MATPKGRKTGKTVALGPASATNLDGVVAATLSEVLFGVKVPRG